MRHPRRWHELVLILILAPLIGLGLGLLAEKAAPTLAKSSTPPTLLNQE